MTASNVSEIMKEEAKTLAGKTKKKETPVLPSEDQEIKQLEERTKKIKKEGKQIRERQNRYTGLEKTLKKKRRQRSRKKRTGHVENILQSGRRPKQIYKGPKQK